MLEWMGLNFYYFDGLQPEMRAGIINEHECSLISFHYAKKKGKATKTWEEFLSLNFRLAGS